MLSGRVKHMEASVTVELTARVDALQRAGVKILTLNVGEPDFHTPDHIRYGAKHAIDEGFTRYTPVAGMYELREAICRKLLKDNGLDYSPGEILVSTGAKQSLINGILSLLDHGDEVILPTPCWVSYREMVKLAGATPVMVKTREEEGFQLDLPAIEKAVTKKTKAIIINTPNNPTGAVYNEESLRALGDLAVEHDFFIISDEIYEKLIYDKEQHLSIASLSPAVKERTLTINGLSKAYAMTGWRIGYAAGPVELIKAMGDLQGHMTSGANSVAQHAGLMALEGTQEPLHAMRAEFDQRRRYLVQRLNRMPGIACKNSKGAFYLMPRVSRLFGKTHQGKVIKNSTDLANFLLEEAQIAVVPGTAFEAPDNIRIAYANSLDTIKEGMDRMENALSLLRQGSPYPL